MANFILIPGIWLGGWAWDKVTKILREAGHEVFPVTLTGMGERVHLTSNEIDLDAHVADVVNIIKYNELENVYLAGHSYGGLVTTQVSDQMPERIAKEIYIDSAPLPDGTAMIDFYEPEQREAFEKSRLENDGFVALFERDSPIVAESLKDVSDADWERFRKLGVPQPFKTAAQKLHLKNPKRKGLSKLGIFNTFSIAQVKELLASDAPLFRELNDSNFEFKELPTGHYPMFSRPAELAALLIDSVKPE